MEIRKALGLGAEKKRKMLMLWDICVVAGKRFMLMWWYHGIFMGRELKYYRGDTLWSPVSIIWRGEGIQLYNIQLARPSNEQCWYSKNQPAEGESSREQINLNIFQIFYTPKRSFTIKRKILISLTPQKAQFTLFIFHVRREWKIVPNIWSPIKGVCPPLWPISGAWCSLLPRVHFVSISCSYRGQGLTPGPTKGSGISKLLKYFQTHFFIKRHLGSGNGRIWCSQSQLNVSSVIKECPLEERHFFCLIDYWWHSKVLASIDRL